MRLNPTPDDSFNPGGRLRVRFEAGRFSCACAHRGAVWGAGEITGAIHPRFSGSWPLLGQTRRTGPWSRLLMTAVPMSLWLSDECNFPSVLRSHSGKEVISYGLPHLIGVFHRFFYAGDGLRLLVAPSGLPSRVTRAAWHRILFCKKGVRSWRTFLSGG